MAVPLYVSALAIFEKTLGPEHPQVRTRARLRARGQAQGFASERTYRRSHTRAHAVRMRGHIRVRAREHRRARACMQGTHTHAFVDRRRLVGGIQLGQPGQRLLRSAEAH